MIKNLVISSGGIRGLGALGLLQKLYENDKMGDIEKYAGSSVGAMICFLLIIGYYPLDVFKILCDIDFKCFFENPNIDSIFDEVCVGLYSQSKIIYIIKKMMKNKNISVNITFKQLYEKFNKTLYITGTCVNTIEEVIFSHETHADMSVITAIAITSCIPCIFKPVMYNNLTWIDGGCLDSYPIRIFDGDLENTTGIFLDSIKQDIQVFESSQQYLFNVLKCLLINSYKIDKTYEKYTYYILTDIKINWDLSIEEKKRYYDVGYVMALKD